MFVIWVDPKKRDEILDYILKQGVSAVINYPAIHLFSYYRKTFRYKEGMFPNAEEIANRTITLPLYAKLTKDEVDYIINTVKRAVTL